MPFASINADGVGKRVEMLDLIGLGNRVVGVEFDDALLTSVPVLSPDIEIGLDRHFDTMAQVISDSAAGREGRLADLEWSDRSAVAHAALCARPADLTFFSTEMVRAAWPAAPPHLPGDVDGLLATIERARGERGTRALFDEEEVQQLESALGEYRSLVEDLSTELEHRREVIDGLAHEAEHRLTVIDELAAEAQHRQQVIGDLAAEAEHRQHVIDDLAAEAEHRQHVIDDLAAEAEHRQHVIDDLVRQRDELARHLAALQAAVDRDPVTKRIVRRRL